MQTERGSQGPRTDNRASQPVFQSAIDRWFHSPMRRRQAIQETGVGLAGAAAGFLGGQELQRRVEQSLDFDDPIEIQIHRLELKNKEGLGNKELRDRYTWLLAFWYAHDHSFGALSEPDDEYGAIKLSNAVTFIEDPNDSRLEGRENVAGWTTREEIFMKLTNLTEPYVYRTTGGTVTPLMEYRDTLVHEFTHFITKEVRSAQVFDVIRQQKSEFPNITDFKGSGFRVYFDPDPENSELPYTAHLVDFDEAATELIANHYQRTAGLATGLPSYPEANQADTDKSQIERTIDTLEASLKIVGISMDKFAELHKESDLDGLTILLADKTDKVFASDTEKIRYGLSIIDALRTTDRKFLGEYIGSIKG